MSFYTPKTKFSVRLQPAYGVLSDMFLALRGAAVALLVGGLAAAWASRADAGPPEQVATVGPGYRELITDGTRVWALRQGPLAWVRMVVNDGEIVAGEEISLPVGALRFAAAPDGVLYAFTLESHGMGARVWKKSGVEAWEPVATFSPGGIDEVIGAEMIFSGPRLVISVALRPWFDDGGSDDFDRGVLLLLDRSTHALTTVEQDVRGLVRDGSVLYGTRHIVVPGGLAIAGVKSSDNGEHWVELANARPLLNAPFPPLILGGPHAVGAARLFSFDFLSYVVVVGRETDAPMAYAIPVDAGMGYKGMRIAREGESWMGIFEETPLEPSEEKRGLVVVSHRYLRDFETHEIGGLAHLDSVALPDAFYLLRDAVGGSALYRISLPGERVPIAEAPQLSIAATQRTFVDPILAAPVVRAMLELGLPLASGGFHQIQTSTDLVEWEPVGLPVPAGSTERLLVEQEIPRRFFR